MAQLLLVTMFYLVPSAAGLFGTFWLLWLEPGLKHALFVVLVSAAFLFSCGAFWAGIRSVTDGGRIVPYFKKPTDSEIGGDAFLAGEAIAAHCESLDALASAVRVAPLSSFGFNDDLQGEALEWHEPTQGLQTVAALIRGVAESHSKLPEADKRAIITDLEKLQGALERARAKGDLFCLMLREVHGSISSIEVENRQGSFF